MIETIKSDFRSEIGCNDSKVIKLYKLRGDLFNLTNQTKLFDYTPKDKAEWEKGQKLQLEIEALEKEIEEIKANKIYENAFEWRFEFLEVLNDNGDFVGFDVVIGNPPYGIDFNEKKQELLKTTEYEFLVERIRNSFLYFIGRGLGLLLRRVF